MGTPWYVDSSIPLSPACPINRRVFGWPRMSFCGNHDNSLTLSLTEILDVPVTFEKEQCVQYLKSVRLSVRLHVLVRVYNHFKL